MHARISRSAARVLAHRLRATRTRPYATQGTPQLDVDDAHLLGPAGGASSEHSPLHDITHTLHLPIGDEVHIQDAGLEPPPVIEEPAPEHAEPQPDDAPRELYEDTVLSLSSEPSMTDYNSRCVVVEIHEGVRHMARAFAVVRYLERTYGRVSHFQLARSADVSEDYRGAIFVTFKHALSVQRIAAMDRAMIQIPEPSKAVMFRSGNVGIDELTDVLSRPVGEFGDAEQRELFQAKKDAESQGLEHALSAEDVPLEAEPDELQSRAAEEVTESSGVDAVSAVGDDEGVALSPAPSEPSPAEGDARVPPTPTVEKNLPQLYFKVFPFETANGWSSSSAPQKEYVFVRPGPYQQAAIGQAFSAFNGFSPIEPSLRPRMQSIMRKWEPFMPAPLLVQHTPPPAPTPAAADAAEPEPAPAPARPPPPEPVPWTPLQRVSPAARAQQAAEKVRAKHRAVQAASVNKKAVQQDKKNEKRLKEQKKLEAARQAQRAANARAQQQQRQQMETTTSGTATPTPTATPAASKSNPAAPAPAAATSAPSPAAPATPPPPRQEDVKTTWKKMSQRLSSFMGIGGGGS
ncbi:hypothetical protein EXIGLDRAFT_839564 [Exidia glandulosa HHB12029]|uniref:Uncharacterized protein n=1 Tax=Exidia glandulosa HHB12029 TaxID=1314781 RepID=A0A165EYG8_EXIGL|nr:hypothetical protein EXIGLDRAFT_839564 [Exidia glandulosa HHB12029]